MLLLLLLQLLLLLLVLLPLLLLLLLLLLILLLLLLLPIHIEQSLHVTLHDSVVSLALALGPYAMLAVLSESVNPQGLSSLL